MPTYIVKLKKDVTPEQIEEAKNKAVEQGGEIGHTYTGIMKGFSVTYPKDVLTTLETQDHVDKVELDQEVTTQ